ncbi:hypothetical protein BSKO_07641 [Bryopsis sp. KO-2023]|nr:hypothetical protein BSKO_07641 [Bryopsis sp. KO-2023]
MTSIEAQAFYVERLHSKGFDICHPGSLKWYNEGVPDDLGVRIPEKGSAGSNAFILLIGNSRHLWKVFLGWLKENRNGVAGSNPLDTYVKESIEEIIQAAKPRFDARFYTSHETADDLVGGGRYVAMQRFSALTGLAFNDISSHLAIHPKFGPWFALRGVIIFDDICCPVENPILARDPLTEDQRNRAKAAMSQALDSNKNLSYEGVGKKWHCWVAVRDALYGQTHPFRYSDDQIEYHYTSNEAHLKKCIEMV